MTFKWDVDGSDVQTVVLILKTWTNEFYCCRTGRKTVIDLDLEVLLKAKSNICFGVSFNVNLHIICQLFYLSKLNQISMNPIVMIIII